MIHAPTHDLSEATLRRTLRVVCYLARYMVWRTSETSIGEHRYANRHRELPDAMRSLVALTRTPTGFFDALCERFGVSPIDGEKATGEKLGPITIEEGGRRVDWNVALASLRHDAVRRLIRGAPGASFIAQFAIGGARDDTGKIDRAAEEAMLADMELPDLTDGIWTAERPGGVYAWRYASLGTAIEPIHHGSDETGGNVKTFRTEPQVDPVTGERSMVAVVSAGAWRGPGRRLMSRDMLARLGLDDRDLPAWRAHELLSGGTLDKGADTAAVNVAYRDEIRRLLPMWDLFGGVSRGQVMEGRLQAGDVLVVCAENAWRCHDVVSAHDPAVAALDVAAWRRALISGEEWLENVRFNTRKEEREIPRADGEKSAQMIFHGQCLKVGTPLLHTATLYGFDRCPDVTRSAFARLLGLMARVGKLGARAAQGQGGIIWSPYAPTAEGMPSLPTDEAYLAHLTERADEIRAFLLDAARGGSKAEKAPKGGKGKRGKADAGEPLEPIPAAQTGLF